MRGKTAFKCQLNQGPRRNKKRSVMNSDRCKPFSNLLGSAFFAAFALTLGTTFAVAQQGQPVPKTTVSKAAPTARAAAPAAAPAGAPAAGAEPGQANGSEWVKLCKKNEQTGNRQLCLVKYEGVDPNTGMMLVTAAVRVVEGEDKQTLMVGVTTADSLVMPAGVQIKIDDTDPVALKYTICGSMNCQAQMDLTKETFDKMRKGKQIIVAAINVQGKTMAFLVPLNGFGKAYDGPPADNAKYEEAKRQMAEKLRQRQIGLANKVADQKKAQGAEQPQAGAPAQP
jgi:invasion protein IalB